MATAGAGIAAVIVAIAAFTGMVSVRGQIRSLRHENLVLQDEINDALSQKVELAAVTRQEANFARATVFENLHQTPERSRIG